ncbi:alkaline phosphatase [Aliidiomarina iranensis]|uniref:Alkaline phosphatase n=1 Tax=Aliidiomarina iranensis TaxID=1434071 RepID=A0A432W0B6_9GAMM|nr:DUF3413 domain-containing protein [Aliidiomarina iranensis]RUO22456.1 alkaline phosphatase [Aliidiomarina iranensis]
MGKHKQRDRIAKLVSWGHWFTLANIFICLIIGLFYVQSALSDSSALATGYLLVSWLGHFAFLPFVFFILLVFPLCLILPYSGILRGYAAIVASVGVFALLFDAIFFGQYGFHLNTYSLTQLTTDAEEWFPGGSFVMLLAVIFSFLFILGLQLILANLSWKRHAELQGKKFAKILAAVFIGSFLVSHSTHIWADATIYTPITQQDDLFPLSYPTTAKSLMARHGWITVEGFQSQRDRLTGNQKLVARYPSAPMLCNKLTNTHGVTVIAFDSLATDKQQRLLQAVPELQSHHHRHLGQRDLVTAVTTLLYGMPDLYTESLKQQNAEPAYFGIMNDFNSPIRIFSTSDFSEVAFPNAVANKLTEFTGAVNYNFNLDVVLAANANVDEIAEFLAAQPSTQRIIITALTNQQVAGGMVNVDPQSLQVPLMTMNMPIPTRQISNLEDILPTALSHFMACAEGFRSFTNGQDMRSETRNLPRVMSVRPYIYIFESNQTTVIDENGDMQLFNAAGEFVPGAVPPTPVFIQSLRELQRFGG